MDSLWGLVEKVVSLSPTIPLAPRQTVRIALSGILHLDVQVQGSRIPVMKGCRHGTSVSACLLSSRLLVSPEEDMHCIPFCLTLYNLCCLAPRMLD